MTTHPIANNIQSKLHKQEELINFFTKIGTFLSTQKNTNTLLELIVDVSMKITDSDGASLYIKETKEKKDYLRFKIARNHSRDFPFKEFVMPIDKNSIAGFSALTGNPYNFKSVDEIPDVLGIKYNDSFDKKINYKTINMLVIPMKNLKGEVIGILQLLNKKKHYDTVLTQFKSFCENIISYSDQEIHIISSLASSAAIVLERRKLYDEIQELFKTFTESMVTTIDQRDPSTAGHSVRVAKYATHFAKAVHNMDYGKYKDQTFSEQQLDEIYYAGLLHDIGKIGVKESVLLKEKRISEHEMEVIKYKFHYLKKHLQIKKLNNTITPSELVLFNDIDQYYNFIVSINSKNFIKEEELNQLQIISQTEFIDIDLQKKKILTENQLNHLSVQRGNLTDLERTSIEKHPLYTYEILKNISWGADLKNVPHIAAYHHEKLNGHGYPFHLEETEIPIQSKILAIVDIFDALTARDRPYKPALSITKTLDILSDEAEKNHIDKDLLDIFIHDILQ
ncbi:HD domain-containing phosphohydrolase [Crassaminicella profunda]|uniref:HD domain-containing phosphohydrolase n=1 Tax=Crassaminicella profunda TaxID=1286698 RepID=UPI001CA6F71D|nr:HD domain-containing phosphohydrolase [Crassaminicella profunda]QZY55276.1 HD domain-containing protein [Crassaminicella profunda]